MITIRTAIAADLPHFLGQAVLRAAQQAAWDADCYKIMLATGRQELVPSYQAAGFVLGGKSFFDTRRT